MLVNAFRAAKAAAQPTNELSSQRLIEASRGRRFRARRSTAIPEYAAVRRADAANLILSSCLLLTAIIVAAPLYPIMPSAGLDPSWMYALNQALADGFIFGREVIFTFGPYGGIYTQMFHPDTDALLMSVGLFFGACLGAVSIVLARNSLWWGLCLLFLLASQIYARDVIFGCYGLLLVTAIANAVCAWIGDIRRFSLLENILFAVLLFALGLLPLIKGSFIVIATASALAAGALFFSVGALPLAAAALVMPVIAVVAFWSVAGQPLGALPQYFSNMLLAISGYTEAMAVDGRFIEVIAYLLAAARFFWVLLRGAARPSVKLPLAAVFAVFLFSAFKAGFVRHDYHALIAAAAIILAPAIINLSAWKTRSTVLLFWIGAAAWLVISTGYLRSAPDLLLFGFVKTYEQGADGVRVRVLHTDDLHRAFADHLATIGQASAFPRLAGTTDIYSYNQALLLGSGYAWRPRPVLQSYAAYTPGFAELDREHLVGGNAPDNILFRVETIDGRLPSLDDGSSWPLLIERYVPQEQRGDYLVLKRAGRALEPPLQPVSAGTFELADAVELPASALLYAQVELQPSLLGRVALVLYKTAPLRITVTLANGETREFRIISSMARAGFLLSPLITDTREFARLSENIDALNSKKVRSMQIDGDPLFWQRNYTLSLSTIQPTAGISGSAATSAVPVRAR